MEASFEVVGYVETIAYRYLSSFWWVPNGFIRMCCNFQEVAGLVASRDPKWHPDRRSSSGRQTDPVLIICAVRWYLRYSLSLRDVEELLEERGLEADHTTVWRWVQRYGPELEHRVRRHLKPTNKSWRVDETYIKVKGRWCYLYRAIDSV